MGHVYYQARKLGEVEALAVYDKLAAIDWSTTGPLWQQHVMTRKNGRVSFMDNSQVFKKLLESVKTEVGL